MLDLLCQIMLTSHPYSLNGVEKMKLGQHSLLPLAVEAEKYQLNLENFGERENPTTLI